MNLQMFDMPIITLYYGSINLSRSDNGPRGSEGPLSKGDRMSVFSITRKSNSATDVFQTVVYNLLVAESNDAYSNHLLLVNVDNFLAIQWLIYAQDVAATATYIKAASFSEFKVWYTENISIVNTIYDEQMTLKG